MNKEIFKSGNYLYVDLAPISSSWRLFQEVVKEFKKNGISLKVDMETELNLKDLILSNMNGCLGGLMDIVTSDNVLSCIVECGSKCLYEVGGVKNNISLDCFEKESARADFFEVMYKIAIRNLRPFFPQVPTE
jgi:hypothetical protein